MTDEQVLSQADIDAMVAGSGTSQASSGAVKPEPVKVNNITDSLPGIKSIPAKKETVAPKTAAPQHSQVKTSSQSEVELLRSTVTALATRLARLENQVIKSDKSFRCDVRNNFQCSSCKSHGKVAMYLKCTCCGEEQWVGWWPTK